MSSSSFTLTFVLLISIQDHQYETVSGFVCEAFGYIPRTGESIKVILEKSNQEEHNDYSGKESDQGDKNEKNQIYKLEVMFCLPSFGSSLK